MPATAKNTTAHAMSWTIRVGGQNYGPYSLAQLRGFAGEGRVKGTSSVRRAGAVEWMDAAQDPALKSLFKDDWPKAVETAHLGFGRTNAKGEAPLRPASFVVVCELISGSAAKIGAAIAELGPSYEIGPGVWIVATANTVAGVRNAVTPHLAPNDRMFIADAMHGKSAWHNYGPEADSKMRAVWRVGER